MKYMRVGSCNRCGLCCKPPIMLENPMIERGQDGCKFYTEVEGTERYGHCLITSSWAPIELARDRFGQRIAQAQIDWFNQNCVDYPSVEDAEAGAMPPAECGFSFEVTDG